MAKINFKFGKRLNAFADGVNTGFDIVGTFLGYFSKYKASNGYLADKYGFKRELEKSYYYTDFTMDKPIKRGIEEQVWKGLGGITGLSANILTLGISQFFRTREYLQKERNRSKTLSMAQLVIDQLRGKLK